MPNLIVGLGVVMGCSVAHALTPDLIVGCTSTTCPASGRADEYAPVMTGCVSYSRSCYESSDGGILEINSCTECEYGFELTQTTYLPSICGANTLLYEYNVCGGGCGGCRNCVSDTSWSSAGTGYMKKVTRTCDCDTCRESTEYRCAAGYYGSPSSSSSGCSACPRGSYSSAGFTSCYSCGSENGVNATTASTATTSKASCYIPSTSGWSFSDTIGSGNEYFKSDCYYSN